jgi:hypothetical protein
LVENEEIEAVVTFDPSDDGNKKEWEVILKDAKIGGVNFNYHSGGSLSDNSFSFAIAFNEIEMSHEESGIAHMDTIDI